MMYYMREMLFPSFLHFTRVRPKVTLAHVLEFIKWIEYYDLREYITLDGEDLTTEEIQEMLSKDPFKERLYIVEDYYRDDDFSPIIWELKTIH